MAAGRLTDAQRDALLARLPERIDALVNRSFNGRRGWRGFGGRAPWHTLGGLDAAATYLGLPEAELREQLRGGRTLAQIAQARGKPVEGLKRALVAAAERELDDAVKAGRLGDERRRRLVAELPARIEERINRSFRRFERRRRDAPGAGAPAPRRAGGRGSPAGWFA